MAGKKQVQAYFSGMVQGVGFRYRATKIANELGIAGWVKNLPDGRVEVVAEAGEEALREFLGLIDESFLRYIKDRQVQWAEASNKLKDFEIRF